MDKMEKQLKKAEKLVNSFLKYTDGDTKLTPHDKDYLISMIALDLCLETTNLKAEINRLSPFEFKVYNLEKVILELIKVGVQ